MNEAGVGSFLQGLMGGYKTAREMAMQQEKIDLEQKTLETEQAKLDLSLQKEANDKQIKTQQEMRKAQEDANKSFEENAGKYGAKVAVDRFNSTISTSDNPARKFIWTDLNGGEHIIDTTVDRIEDMKFINAEYLTKKGEGKYNFDPKTSTVYGKNENGQFVPTSYTGTDVNVFKTAYEESQTGTGTETIDVNGVPTVVRKIDAIGKKAYYKPDKTASGDIEGQQSLTGKTIRDWEFYNKGLKKSNPSKYEEDKAIFVQGLFGQKAEGRIDPTYQTKFDNAYNMLKKENPDMDEIELRKLADEEIRSTQQERTSKKIENMEKSIKSKFKVNNISEINVTEARKDKTNTIMLDNYFIEKAKDKLGQTWQDDVKTASTAVSNADKVFDAGSVYAKDIINGDSGINVVNRLFDNTIGSYINKNLTSDEKLNASKDLASIMNVVRNEQFGAVVPLAEQTNFNDAVTNLTKSSPDIVRGTISMLKQQRTSIKTSKDILGEELFTVKFGDKLEKLDDKIAKLESSLKPEQKTPGTKKPLSEIFK